LTPLNLTLKTSFSPYKRYIIQQAQPLMKLIAEFEKQKTEKKNFKEINS